MARVSKKVSAAQREAENAPHRIWKTAIYARLSDFDDVLRDTESLEVQISYIKEYINHRDDLMLLDVFADKRCTGMNIDRPEFERLLKALQDRKVNCIVVKDFSRLGRNFVETGQYVRYSLSFLIHFYRRRPPHGSPSVFGEPLLYHPPISSLNPALA